MGAMGQISIVIPTLNAAADLRQSLPPLAAFEALGVVHEVIFTDGGSNDETHAIAEAAGAEVVSGVKGRGTQLAAGAKASNGSWLLFLHADTRLDKDWFEAVDRFMNDPENAGRAAFFRFRLDDGGVGARMLERLVALRVALLGLPYGDQGLLISRQLYESLGGFEPLPLMEDVDLIRRIGRKRLVGLNTDATTSAKRYRKDGYLLRPLRNVLCLALYYIGLPPRIIAKFYA